ncbi:ABC transporter ATP-binding protein [Paenibacillus albus]|uniref:ABC transporter ATP-binding protein n=1 Tax=Paenibacillus albus TaxID=2495582 RepID=A0A3S9A7P4_9BACL|nr:ABC transporter ATP-binding protein [Paenibacillus albus]AZN41750.1 ABC transporter ATP-binding protein [Paenibacillus albus]
MSLIRMEHISKYFRMGGETIKALDDINLVISQGEFVAIIGPSGSGKSTLMNVLGCLDAADTGVYAIEEQVVSKLRSNQLAELRNKKIGFIFQQFNLLPRLSAYENVELPLIYRGVGKKTRHKLVLEMLEMVDLLERKDHKPTELSGGQQQRVAIARALVGDPPIVLADEPTGALDTQTGIEVLNLMNKMNALGRTIILITHDPSIAACAKRIIKVQDGQISSDSAELA